MTGTLAEVPATEERAPAARRRGATVPRWHWAVLVGLVVLAAARGLYWVGILEIWRGDEAQHYSYVQQIAEGEGIPVIGVDHISDDAALLYRGYRGADHGGMRVAQRDRPERHDVVEVLAAGIVPDPAPGRVGHSARYAGGPGAE